jgi:hypothetical protein
MRDSHAIALFRLEDVVVLFQAGMSAEAIYLLIWALVIQALL